MFSNVRKSVLAVAMFAVGTAAGGGVAMAYQSHMYSALQDLRAARAQLAAAMSDKGGHRTAAIGLVDRAIYQTQAGISYGRM
jgi:hypothetical protein